MANELDEEFNEEEPNEQVLNEDNGATTAVPAFCKTFASKGANDTASAISHLDNVTNNDWTTASICSF